MSEYQQKNLSERSYDEEGSKFRHTSSPYSIVRWPYISVYDISITKGINDDVQVRYRIGLNVVTGLRTNERYIFLFTVARLKLNLTDYRYFSRYLSLML